MRRPRAQLALLLAIVVGLFVAGAVWRATHPERSGGNVEERQLDSRQHGYYLCLPLPVLTDAARRALVRAKLPNDDQAWALRGCQEAQKR